MDVAAAAVGCCGIGIGVAALRVTKVPVPLTPHPFSPPAESAVAALWGTQWLDAGGIVACGRCRYGGGLLLAGVSFVVVLRPVGRSGGQTNPRLLCAHRADAC